MNLLSISAEGLAASPSLEWVASRAVGKPLATGINGVYCWASDASAPINDTATTYLRSVGAILPHERVTGEVVFAALDATGRPVAINEVALEALGWQIARSVITAIENRIAA